MTSLVACLTTGKGTWGEVNALINAAQWDKVFLVTAEFGTKFTASRPVDFVVINPDAELMQIRDMIFGQLKGKIVDTEVALNVSSGSGKEHMAVLGAVLKLGFGVRLVSVKDGKVIHASD